MFILKMINGSKNTVIGISDVAEKLIPSIPEGYIFLERDGSAYVYCHTLIYDYYKNGVALSGNTRDIPRAIACIKEDKEMVVV